MTDIITAVNSLPKGVMICSTACDGWDADFTTDDLHSLTAEVAALQAKVAEYEATVTELQLKVQATQSLHFEMMTPRGISGNTVHGCELCDALNDLAARLQEEQKP